MSNKKGYRKYAATTMAVAAAVASVASIATTAATKDFSDVNKNHDFYKEIMSLTEQGIINGYEDGTFGPGQDIKRVQSANILLRALKDVKAPADIDGTLAGLKDVDKDTEYADTIATAVAEGIFRGNKDGYFNPWKPITREQMASTLVRAFGLENYEAEKTIDINLKGVDESHKENVQILANLGITRGAALKDFGPIKPITRGQFSAMVYRALEVVNDEIVVQSVTAVPTTIKNEENQQLPIQINQGRDVTVDQLKEAGYEVEFNYNKRGDAYNKESGVVNGAAEDVSSTFKYQVVITPADGEAIKSEWADVNVLKAETPVKVTEIGLSNNLPYVTLGEEDVAIDVLKAVNAFGEELESGYLPEIVSIESSNPKVAYVTDEGKINPRKEGSVVFTVNFKEGSELDPIKLSVEVKAAQKVSAIKAEDVKVEADAEYEYSYDLLDQYGEKMRSDVETVDVITDENEEEVTGSEVFGTAGTYTVNVYVEDTAKEDSLGEKLGSFTVTTVDVAEGEVDEFKLTTAEDFEIDINADLTGDEDKTTGELKIEAFIDGVKIKDVASKLETNNPNLKYELRTSDADIVTINGEQSADAEATNTLKGVNAGTAEISLVQVEGDLETVLDTLEVVVKNSTKMITSVDFKEGVEAVTVDVEESAPLITAVKDATNLEAKHIADVEYAAADKVVIVTIKDIYGGEEFVLPAVKGESKETDDAEIETSSTINVEDNELAITYLN